MGRKRQCLVERSQGPLSSPISLDSLPLLSNFGKINLLVQNGRKRQSQKQFSGHKLAIFWAKHEVVRKGPFRHVGCFQGFVLGSWTFCLVPPPFLSNSGKKIFFDPKNKNGRKQQSSELFGGGGSKTAIPWARWGSYGEINIPGVPRDSIWVCEHFL